METVLRPGSHAQDFRGHEPDCGQPRVSGLAEFHILKSSVEAVRDRAFGTALLIKAAREVRKTRTKQTLRRIYIPT
jgi:hypothetical protein